MAVAHDEIEWAKAYAKPRINPRRSIETPEDPKEYISLLERYILIAPRLASAPSRMSLSHPDLHLDNIFVDPDTKEISCIIDWQSTSVSEPFFQNSMPQMLIPTGPQSAGSSSESSIEDEGNQTTAALSYYRTLKLKDRSRWAALDLHDFQVLADPVPFLCGVWRRNDVLSLRQALVDLERAWNKVEPKIPFPAKNMGKERELCDNELENAEGIREIVQLLDAQNLVPLGGMVHPQHYEVASNANHNARRELIEHAESKLQRNLCAKIWPYQDEEVQEPC